MRVGLDHASIPRASLYCNTTMAYIVMASMVIFYIVIVHVVMAYKVMAWIARRLLAVTRV